MCLIIVCLGLKEVVRSLMKEYELLFKYAKTSQDIYNKKLDNKYVKAQNALYYNINAQYAYNFVD